MDRRSIASLITIGGITLAVMKMIRRRNRPTGMKAMMSWLGNMSSMMRLSSHRMMNSGQRMLNNSSNMLHGIRKKARM